VQQSAQAFFSAAVKPAVPATNRPNNPVTKAILFMFIPFVRRDFMSRASG
jgi:hypothetical protein